MVQEGVSDPAQLHPELAVPPMGADNQKICCCGVSK
jgi:hypothetical protein